MEKMLPVFITHTKEKKYKLEVKNNINPIFSKIGLNYYFENKEE